MVFGGHTRERLDVINRAILAHETCRIIFPHFSEHGGHFKHYKFLCWSPNRVLIGTGALLDALIANFKNFDTVRALPITISVSHDPIHSCFGGLVKEQFFHLVSHDKSKSVNITHAFHHGSAAAPRFAIHLLTGVSADIVLFFADLVRTRWFAYGAEKHSLIP